MTISVRKYPHPILKAGLLSGSFLSKDALWAYHPVVIEYDGLYRMFYTGKSVAQGIAHHTLYAESEDLFSWTKRSVPILSQGTGKSWDSDFTAHAYVFQDKRGYAMLYDGSQKGNWLEEIGLARSGNIISWKKDRSNPVFYIGTAWWERRHVSRCCIYIHKGVYFLFYAGHDGMCERIGLARGKSLKSLKRVGTEPVLDLGGHGDWDEKSISDPRVIKHGNTYIMFYSGISADGIERTGAATSRDLVTWKKYRQNPILDVTEGAWDSISASRAHVAAFGPRLYLFYSGRRRLFYHIGVAEVTIT